MQYNKIEKTHFIFSAYILFTQWLERARTLSEQTDTTMTDISVWYKNLPIFTKYWLSLTVGISLLARFGILQGYWLHLAPYLVTSKFQVSVMHPKLTYAWMLYHVYLRVIDDWSYFVSIFTDMETGDVHILLSIESGHRFPLHVELLLSVQLFTSSGDRPF